MARCRTTPPADTDRPPRRRDRPGRRRSGSRTSHFLTLYEQLRAGPGSDLNTDNPTFKAANEACRALSPGGQQARTPSAPNIAAEVRWARCMRSYGVPSFPDPNKQGAFDSSKFDPPRPRFKLPTKSAGRCSRRERCRLCRGGADVFGETEERQWTLDSSASAGAPVADSLRGLGPHRSLCPARVPLRVAPRPCAWRVPHRRPAQRHPRCPQIPRTNGDIRSLILMRPSRGDVAGESLVGQPASGCSVRES